MFGCTKHGKEHALKLDPADKRLYRGLALPFLSPNRRELFSIALQKSFVVPLDIVEAAPDDSSDQHHDTITPSSNAITPSSSTMSTGPSWISTFSSSSHRPSNNCFLDVPEVQLSVDSGGAVVPPVRSAGWFGTAFESGSARHASTISVRVPRVGVGRAQVAWSNRIMASSTRRGEPTPLGGLGGLDAFVRACACGGGVQGEINGWTILRSARQAPTLTVPLPLSTSPHEGRVEQSSQIKPFANKVNEPPLGVTAVGQEVPFVDVKVRYQIIGNRYCANVGRAHKSNGIFFEVDLSSGLLTQVTQ